MAPQSQRHVATLGSPMSIAMMYSLIRPLLFALDAEKAHEITMSLLNVIPAFCFKKSPLCPVRAMGLEFPHPVGLAAGLDKNGDYIDALAKLGFSFIEIGSITPRPQSGNSKPRLFRLTKKEALINRMGFNNAGVDALVANVERANFKGILGINIGKNKDTPLEKAVDDYLHCLHKVYAHASYVTINISSPNTADLRQLQQKEYFTQMMKALREAQLRLGEAHKRHVPLVVKISPDEPDDVLKQMGESVVALGIEGMIATNTSSSKEMVKGEPFSEELGGLSGAPIASKAMHCLKVLKQVVGDEVTLIGLGGIDSPKAAKARQEAGATLIQLYTGLIFKGPNLVPNLVEGLMKAP